MATGEVEQDARAGIGTMDARQAWGALVAHAKLVCQAREVVSPLRALVTALPLAKRAAALLLRSAARSAVLVAPRQGGLEKPAVLRLFVPIRTTLEEVGGL